MSWLQTALSCRHHGLLLLLLLDNGCHASQLLVIAVTVLTGRAVRLSWTSPKIDRTTSRKSPLQLTSQPAQWK